jgi:hypothetical protein
MGNRGPYVGVLLSGRRERAARQKGQCGRRRASVRGCAARKGGAVTAMTLPWWWGAISPPREPARVASVRFALASKLG